MRIDAKYLVTIGTCATTGGIQALHNWDDVAMFTRIVYPTPAYIETRASCTPISAHVTVDFEVNGCPINLYQLLWDADSPSSGPPAAVGGALGLRGVQAGRSTRGKVLELYGAIVGRYSQFSPLQFVAGGTECLGVAGETAQQPL